MPQMSWSPDSRRIALIDCTYDWTADDPQETRGKESNRRCSIAVVSPDGKFELMPLTNVPPSELFQATLTWSGSEKLVLSTGGVSKEFEVKTSAR